METIKLANGVSVDILDGATLNHTVIVANDFTTLGTIANALINNNSLKTVQYISNNEVVGEYSDMLLESPLFSNVYFGTDGKVNATISIREKTDIEKRLEALEAGQQVQDGAITDLGDVVSAIAEGGAI